MLSELPIVAATAATIILIASASAEQAGGGREGGHLRPAEALVCGCPPAGGGAGGTAPSGGAGKCGASGSAHPAAIKPSGATPPAGAGTGDAGGGREADRQRQKAVIPQLRVVARLLPPAAGGRWRTGRGRWTLGRRWRGRGRWWWLRCSDRNRGGDEGELRWSALSQAASDSDQSGTTGAVEMVLITRAGVGECWLETAIGFVWVCTLNGSL